MVTQAAKDLLKNTIQSVGFHNRVLEEQDMWKQWELEQGLTMMVSDDHIRQRIAARRTLKTCSDTQGSNRTKHGRSPESTECRKRRRSQKKSASNGRMYQKKNTVASGDRWDHSGFYELEYGSSTYEQKRHGTYGDQRSRSSSSEDSRGISQPLAYGPKVPPLPQKNPRQTRRKSTKTRSPTISSLSSSSSTSSSSLTSSSTSSYSSEVESQKVSSESELSTLSSGDEGRSSKRRRYRKLQRERRGRSPTRRRAHYQVETYGQCLKLRQANKRKATAKRQNGRSNTYSSTSESEIERRNKHSNESVEDSSSESLTSSSSSADGDKKLPARVAWHRDRPRHLSADRNRQYLLNKKRFEEKKPRQKRHFQKTR